VGAGRGWERDCRPGVAQQRWEVDGVDLQPALLRMRSSGKGTLISHEHSSLLTVFSKKLAKEEGENGKVLAVFRGNASA